MSFDGQSADTIQSRLRHVTYLQDSFVDVEGLVVYGSPWTVLRPASPAFAFTKPQNDMKLHCWQHIPNNVDILVTHGPPYDIIDDSSNPIGCLALREEVLSRIRYVVRPISRLHATALIVN